MRSVEAISDKNVKWEEGRREGMEDWKDGRLEGWKIGRMEDWKDGRLEGWKIGRMEGWKDGRMEGWKDGRMEGWFRRCRWTGALQVGRNQNWGRHGRVRRSLGEGGGHPSLKNDIGSEGCSPLQPPEPNIVPSDWAVPRDGRPPGRD